MAPTPDTSAEFEKLSPTAYRISVCVPPEIFKRRLDKVYSELAQNASIPGFRPGKAPRHILNRHFDYSNILDDACEGVIEETLWPVLKEKEFIIVGRPRVDHDKWNEGEQFQYTARVEIIPPIPQVDYSSLKAIIPEHELTDEIMDEEIRRVSLRFGESKPVKDRPVQKGDFVLVRFEGEVPDFLVDSLEGKVPWKYLQEHMEIEIGRGKAIAGIEDALLGMQIEEVKEFEMVLPDDFADPRVRGKKMKANARILAIQEVTPVELTDELIKEKLGEKEIDSIAGLRDRLTDEIRGQWVRMDERAVIDQLEAQLSSSFDFPLPEGLVRSKFVDILDRSLDALKEGSTDIDELMGEGNEAGIGIRKRARYQAERLVRLDLIMREIARKESIRVTNEEIANYLMMLAFRQGLSEKDLKTLMADPQFIESTREELLQKKVTHFLLEQVEPERVKEDEFGLIMEKAREEGEENERQFLDNIEDPFISMKEDYLAGDGSANEAGEGEENGQSVPQ